MKGSNLNEGVLIRNTNEYVAIMSMYYNGEGLLRSKKRLLVNALINDNRAEAWYEIRYESNLAHNSTLADRRYRESDLFGIYDNGDWTENEAKEIMRMYTKHQVAIEAYELQHAPSNPIEFEVLSAKNNLIETYGRGNPIDEVIVGAGLPSYNYKSGDQNPSDSGENSLLGTENRDLMFGEVGDDTLRGFAGNDVIYGGQGNDRLIGGGGSDTLLGGPGDDRYLY